MAHGGRIEPRPCLIDRDKPACCLYNRLRKGEVCNPSTTVGGWGDDVSFCNTGVRLQREGPNNGSAQAMALKLTLKPGEKLVINGAVITNGDRRASLIIQNKVSVLREKDIMQADEVNTPVRRVYFPIMLMYLDEAKAGEYYDEFVVRMTELMGAIEDPDALAKCLAISRDVMNRNYYRALMTTKKLFAFEKERLEYVS